MDEKDKKIQELKAQIRTLENDKLRLKEACRSLELKLGRIAEFVKNVADLEED